MELVPVSDPTVWRALTDDAPFVQSWCYGAVAEAFGAEVLRFDCRRDGESVAAVQCLSRRMGPVRFLYAPGGVHALGDVSDGLALSQIMRACPGHAIAVAPGSVGLRVGTVSDSATVDLCAPRPKAWRNAVARAGRKDLFVMEHAGCPDWLWARHRAHGRTRRFRGLPLRWLQEVERLRPGTVRTFAAYHGGAPVAGIVVLRQSGRWTYLIGWSGQAGRQRGAHNLLLDRAMTLAADAGARRMDLGVASVATPGLRRFKLSCGARIVTGTAIRAIFRPASGVFGVGWQKQRV